MYYDEVTGDFHNEDFEQILDTEFRFDIPYLINKEKYENTLRKYNINPRVKDADIVVFNSTCTKDDDSNEKTYTFFAFPRNSPEGSDDFYECIQFGDWFEEKGRPYSMHNQFITELISCISGPSQMYCYELKKSIMKDIKQDLEHIELIDNIISK